MNGRDARMSDLPSHRGYTVDDVWYQYSSEYQGQEDRRAADAAAAVSTAIHDLEIAKSELSAVQSLLYVVRVSLVVQEDVLALCQGCTEVMEAINSGRDTLSGRARAAERRDARALRRQDLH